MSCFLGRSFQAGRFSGWAIALRSTSQALTVTVKEWPAILFFSFLSIRISLSLSLFSLLLFSSFPSPYLFVGFFFSSLV